MKYKHIKTQESYNQLLSSGMFFEFHPELTGNWNVDKEVINNTNFNDKIYRKVEIEGTTYWLDELEITDVRPYINKYHCEKLIIINKFPNYLTDLSECKLIVAQSKPVLEGVPIINLDDNFNILN